MKCVLCKNGETEFGLVTVTLQRGATTVVHKGVPAEVCKNCSEYYLAEETSQRLLHTAEQAARVNTEVEIIQYAA